MKHFTITPQTTVDQIKARYRELAKIHHPDKGGNAETMKTVNIEYVEALKAIASDSSRSDKTEANKLLIEMLEELKVHYPAVFGIISMFNNNMVLNLLSETLAETISKAAEKGKQTPTDDVAKLFGNLLK